MKVLVLDNYDSFTYNLVHLLRGLNVKHEVHRNDKINAEEAGTFDSIILSPGPGIPSEAGNMPEIISACAGKKPMLGICLGHQAIAEFLGAKLLNMDKVFHGVKTMIIVKDDSDIFDGIPTEFEAGRYHSWTVSKNELPSGIHITAEDESGDIMAFSNESKKMYGVQFHPESIMTEFGATMIENFVNIHSEGAGV